MVEEMRVTVGLVLILVVAGTSAAVPPAPPAELLSRGRSHYFQLRPSFVDIPQSPPTVRAEGVSRALVLLIDFDDKPGDRDLNSPQHFEEKLFGTGQRSVRAYFEENSYGRFSLVGDVYGWFRSPCKHGDIVNGDGTPGTPDDYGLDTTGTAIQPALCEYPLNVWGLVAQAVELAGSSIDFPAYDNDGPDGIPSSGDDDGVIDALFVVHSGFGAEVFAWLPGAIAVDYIWSLQSDLDSYEPTAGTWVQGKRIGPFLLVPEMGEIGVFAHEFCHLLGVPDLYNSRTGLPVVGSLCLMGEGVWNGPQHSIGSVPSHLCAPMKYLLGWIEPVRICLACDGTDGLSGAGVLPLGSTYQPGLVPDMVAYEVSRNPGGMDWTSEGTGSGEYFILENRQPTYGYFEAYLPGSGLIIWKVDESQPNNNNPSSRLAEVIQADGEVVNPEITDPASPLRNVPGDSSDFWPGSLGKASFTPQTTPASDLSGGRFSGVGVENISQETFGLVRADIRVGLPRKGPSYAFPNPYRLSEGRPMHIVFLPDPGPSAPNSGSFSVLVFDLEGNLVRLLDSGEEVRGDGTALWDGRDEAGKVVDPGLYLYSIESSGREAGGLIAIRQ